MLTLRYRLESPPEQLALGEAEGGKNVPTHFFLTFLLQTGRDE